MNADTFVCGISGVTAPGDEDGEPPAGWAMLVITVRTLNPEWQAMDQVRQSVIEQQLAAVAEDKREAARPTVEMLVRANFAALEASLPRHLVDEREVYVSDAQLPALLEQLGETDEEGG